MNTLAFAIRMEQDGEQYYRDQAARSSDPALQTVFRLLADAEQRHAALIRDLEQKKGIDPERLGDVDDDNPFSHLEDFQGDAVSDPEQLDVYRYAQGIEEKSIQLYSGLMDGEKDDMTRSVLQFLVEEETRHLELFRELERRLSRPKEWVEDAEFGPREEY